MSQNSLKDDKKWAQIIEVVRTPLAFFALVVLVIEAGFGIFAYGTEGQNQTILISGMIGILLLLIIAVIILSYLRPEALFGKRYKEDTFHFEIFDQKVVISPEKINNLEQKVKSSISEYTTAGLGLGVLPYSDYMQIEKCVMKLQMLEELFDFDYLEIKNPYILLILGSYYFITEELFQSKKFFEKAEHIDSKNPAALFSLGLIYQRDGKFDVALGFFDRVLSAGKEKGWGYLGKGKMLKRIKKSDNIPDEIGLAIIEFDKAIKKNKKDYISYFGLADAYMLKNDYDNVEENLTHVINIRPDLAPAYLNRAIARLKKNVDIESVVSDLRRAIRFNPELIRSVKRDHDFDSIREDKCYKCLIE